MDMETINKTIRHLVPQLQGFGFTATLHYNGVKDETSLLVCCFGPTRYSKVILPEGFNQLSLAELTSKAFDWLKSADPSDDADHKTQSEPQSLEERLMLVLAQGVDISLCNDAIYLSNSEEWRSINRPIDQDTACYLVAVISRNMGLGPKSFTIQSLTHP